MCNQEECEQERPQPPLDEWLKKNKHEQPIIAANRDGDWHFIECPECGSLDLNQKNLIACRNCHTFFNLNFEDGKGVFDIISDSKIYSRDKIKIVKLEPDDDYRLIYPRDYERIKELKEKYPNMKIVELCKDLHKGMDAHGHGKYKRYALIPLN